MSERSVEREIEKYLGLLTGPKGQSTLPIGIIETGGELGRRSIIALRSGDAQEILSTLVAIEKGKFWSSVHLGG